MLIKYQFKKKALSIFSDAKVLSSDFRKWFLNRLIEEVDLYEYLSGDIKLLNAEIIEKSAVLDSFGISNLKKCYELDKIDNMSFEEFLESDKVVFANIYLFPKGTIVQQKDIKKNKNLLAIIDLQPDGDTNWIWIGNFAENDFFIKLINKYNENYNLI